jgi:2-oxoisovalerate dehydrogenase E1 component
MKQVTNIEAVRDAIAVEMRRDPDIVVLGEGIGERGGSFAHTKGLYQEFGGERVIDTPISELGFTGAGIGAASTGLRPIVDLMFADFLAESISQLVNQAAKAHHMSNGQYCVPLVVRAAMGSVRGASAHHSGCLYPWFMHIPGFKVVTPSNPADGYGLMRTALRDNNPVIFLDHKQLFAAKGDAPDPELVVPFGKARLWREGTHLTVVAVSMMVHGALAALDQLPDVSADVIDPRTLVPLDYEAIYASVRKTGRLLIVDEAYPVCSFASEVAANVATECLYDLDAPIRRIHPVPVTHPSSQALEEAMMPTADGIAAVIRELLED